MLKHLDSLYYTHGKYYLVNFADLKKLIPEGQVNMTSELLYIYFGYAAAVIAFCVINSLSIRLNRNVKDAGKKPNLIARLAAKLGIKYE